MAKPKKDENIDVPDKCKILGVSTHIISLLEKIKNASKNDDNVLITGPTGTGKELAAFNIHWNRNHSQENLVKINCAAISKELFDSEFYGIEKQVASGVSERDGYIKKAEGGTLFLDEVGDLAKEHQAKLLRFLNDKTYMTVGGRNTITANVKIVAATNKDLRKEADKGCFREDLFYRLNRQTIHTEALSGKLGDIICLVNHYSHTQNKNDPRVKFLLYLYDYPGNVRDLQTLVEKNYEEVLAIIKERAKNLNEINENDIMLNGLADMEKLFSYYLSLIDYRSQNVDKENDLYFEWFGDLSNYGFTEKNQNDLKHCLDLTTSRARTNNRDKQNNLTRTLLDKRSLAILNRNKDILDRRLRFYEIAILVQDYDCSKKVITDYLHIRSEKLSPHSFKIEYHFHYPQKGMYEVKAPIDVFPRPKIADEFDEDVDDEDDQDSNDDFDKQIEALRNKFFPKEK